MRKQNTMYAKFAALLMTVILLTGCMCCTMVAASENLLAEYKTNFEDSEHHSNVSLGGNTAEFTLEEGEGHESNGCVSLPNVEDLLKIEVRDKVEPQTNYDLSFWMTNSEANSLAMYGSQNLFVRGNKVLSNFATDWYYKGRDYAFTPEYDKKKPLLFGEARSEGEENVWRKVTLNFTTPFDLVNGLNIIFYCYADDEHLKIDDIVLEKTNKNLGYIYNGDFEAINGSVDAPIPFEFNWHGFNYSKKEDVAVSYESDFVLNEENGNHYVKILPDTTNEYFRSIVPKHHPLVLKGYNEGKRYKISFKYRTNDSSARPMVWLYNDNISVPVSEIISTFPKKTIDKWETYTLYLDATKYKNDASLQSLDAGKNSIDVRFGYTKYETDLDDLSVTFDGNNIGFFKSLSLNAHEGNKIVPLNSEYLEASAEKGDAVSSLNDIAAKKDVKTVYTRAHVIPTENVSDGTPNGTFNKEEITLFTAVYKYEGEKKTLVDINIATDSSTDGTVMDAVGTVSVPVDTDTATYKVEAVCWDMTNGIVPIMDKAVLQ